MPSIRLLELRSTYKWGGGPDKTILLSAEQHDPTRVSVVVAYLRDVRDREFQITEMARKRDLMYYEVLESGKIDLKALWAIRKIIIQHNINLIHAHDYKTDLFAYLLRWSLWGRRIALISTAHGFGALLGIRGELYRRLDLYLMKRFDHLIAVSKATQDEMVAAGIPESKISVINNGIDTETWSPQRAKVLLSEGENKKTNVPTVGYIGRLMPEKDLKTWLQAAALVVKRYPQAHFVLVGEGRDEQILRELQALVVSLGIDDRVVFAGYRRDLLAIYATFDVFAMSSLQEGVPNCILEAMSLGIPVVTTDFAGVSELVVHDESGFIVPKRNPTLLARGILTVLDDKGIRDRLGQGGRRRIERKFSFSQRLRRIENLYDQILGVNSMARLSADSTVQYES